MSSLATVMTPKSLTSVRSRYAVLVAVIFVIHLMAGIGGREFAVSADGAEYLRMAEHMLAGHGFTFDGENPVIGKAPGTSAMIAAHLGTVGSMWGFHVLQLTILFLGYLAVMTITKRTFGTAPSMAVLVGLVLLQPVRDLAANALSEPLFIASFAWGLALLQGALLDRDWRLASLAGVLTGAATYTRPVSFFWLFLLVPTVYLACRSRLAIAAIAMTAYAVVVSPWVVRGYTEFGKLTPMASNWGPMLTMTDDTLWQQFSRSGTREVYQSPHFVRAAEAGFLFNCAPQEILRTATVDGWKRDPLGTAWRCARQSIFAWTYCPGTKEWMWKHPLAFWLGRVAMGSFLLVSAIGLFVLWRDNRLTALLVGGQALYAAAVMFPVASEARYLVPSYICLLPATAAGLMSFIRKRQM